MADVLDTRKHFVELEPLPSIRGPTLIVRTVVAVINRGRL
jgi:hypothetical protein